MVEGNQEDALYGRGAATAGDVNGDGAADLIVGAPYYDNGDDDEGRAYIYLGTSNPVAAGRAGSLVLDKAVGGNIQLSWAASCLVTDSDYAIYEGELGDFASHAPVGAPNPGCTTGGATSATITPSPGDRYYLVAPLSSNREGSLGVDSVGNPRTQGASICRLRQIGSCP